MCGEKIVVGIGDGFVVESVEDKGRSMLNEHIIVIVELATHHCWLQSYHIVRCTRR